MRIKKKLKKVILDAITSNSSPQKLSQSFCVGIYIAFSPFPGMHTIMMFAAQSLFRLNFPIMFFSTSFNNPWTIIPFFAFDYYFGHWLLHSFFKWNPGLNISLEKIFGSGKICIISFLAGGNILGIACACLSYPIMLYMFSIIKNRSIKSFEPIFTKSSSDQTHSSARPAKSWQKRGQTMENFKKNKSHETDNEKQKSIF